MVIGVMIGAKLFYLLPRLGELWKYRTAIFKSLDSFTAYLGGGFVFYGGLIGGVAAAFLYCVTCKKPASKMIEIAVPSFPLIHGIGRIGCLMAGCCYGIPVKPWLGIAFRNSIEAPNGVPLFPVQLLEASLNLILFFILLLYTRRERIPYQTLGLYLWIYSIERFLIEFLRNDNIRGIYAGLSTSQWISMILFPVGVYLFLSKSNRGQNAFAK
jgi:phosphatidylglycerol:prolipoprotein diacylglycerol transferase